MDRSLWTVPWEGTTKAPRPTVQQRHPPHSRPQSSETGTGFAAREEEPEAEFKGAAVSRQQRWSPDGAGDRPQASAFPTASEARGMKRATPIRNQVIGLLPLLPRYIVR